MFDTFFGLKLAHFIFSAAEQFSVNLQAKDITIQEAIHGAELLVCHLKAQRTESKFNQFYDQIVELSSNLTEPPKLPRYRKIPRRYDRGGLEVLLVSAANGELEQGHQIPEALSSYMEADVDQACLKVQLLMIPDMIKTAFDGSIRKVTTIRTLADAMNKSEIYKGMLSEVDKLLKLCFTFPVTSATAERAFSSLCRIKTFLRSTMTHCRLNNLFCCIFTSMTDMLDLSSIAKQFVSINS